MSSKSISPVFMPVLAEGQTADVSPGRVERLAMVLAGVDPKLLDELKPASGVQSRTLDQLRRESTTRKISPAAYLARDHRYLLLPYYGGNDEDFKELWAKSKLVSGGQESTELIKQVNWLKKVKLVESTQAFVQASDQQFAAAMPQLAPKALFYLYRSAVRHIEKSAWELPPPLAPVSLLNRLLQKVGVNGPPPPPAVFFPEAILRETEAYLVSMIKLGRVLRIEKKASRRARA